MKKAWHVIRSIIRKIDIFGVPMKLKLFKNDEYCTCYGSLLTVILIVFLAYKTITLLIEMLTRQDFDFKLLDLPDIETPLHMTNFTLYACPVNQNNPALWSFGNFINFNSEVSEPITPNHCSLINSDGSKSTVFKNCQCYDMGKHKLTDSNNFNQLTASIAMFSLNLNNIKQGGDDSSGQPPVQSSNDICLFYTNAYVNTLDYYYPFQVKNQMHFIQNVSGKHIAIDFFAQNIEIIRENDIQFGEQEKQSVEHNKTNIQSVRIQTTKVESQNGLMTIQFFHTGWMKRYRFNGFDNDKFFSTLGGYYEIWIWFFSLLGQLINGVSLKFDIRKRLIKKQEKAMTLELNNIKEKQLIQFDLENMNLEQRPAGEVDKNTAKLHDISLNPNNINNESNKCMDSPIKPPSCLSLKKPEGNEAHGPPLKREQIEDTFNPVKQFEHYLDLQYVYQLIQEVKLLELLCLNQKSAVLFFNCRNCEFDLEKLERYTKDASLCIEDKFSMDSFENKIEIIQLAMIDDTTLKKESLFNRFKKYIHCKKKPK